MLLNAESRIPAGLTGPPLHVKELHMLCHFEVSIRCELPVPERLQQAHRSACAFVPPAQTPKHYR